MFFGTCIDCGDVCKGALYEGELYCITCTEYYEMANTRCFSFAAVYDMQTGKLLSVGASRIGTGCAERQALWKLDDQDNVPKSVVVCRVRRSRRGKISFGTSKPCAQCILAMQFYNVVNVCYSGLDEFTWDNLNDMHNEYTSQSNVLIRL